MQKKRRERILSWILCMTLIVAMAMYTTGCSGKSGESEKSPVGTEQETDVQSLGEGEKKFDFTVIDADGNETPYVVQRKLPEVTGVVVIAEGAGNTKVKENIIGAVSVLFNLNEHRIKVIRMKS